MSGKWQLAPTHNNLRRVGDVDLVRPPNLLPKLETIHMSPADCQQQLGLKYFLVLKFKYASNIVGAVRILFFNFTVYHYS